MGLYIHALRAPHHGAPPVCIMPMWRHRWTRTSPPRAAVSYSYFPRGWVRQLYPWLCLWNANAQHAQGAGNPYFDYVGGALVFPDCGLPNLWLAGVFAYLGLCFYAQSQLAMVGLTCNITVWHGTGGPMESYAPQTIHHSWNSPHWFFSSHMMVNASRHYRPSCQSGPGGLPGIALARRDAGVALFAARHGDHCRLCRPCGSKLMDKRSRTGFWPGWRVYDPSFDRRFMVLALPVAGATPMTAAEFEAYVTGRTLTLALRGRPMGWKNSAKAAAPHGLSCRKNAAEEAGFREGEQICFRLR